MAKKVSKIIKATDSRVWKSKSCTSNWPALGAAGVTLCSSAKSSMRQRKAQAKDGVIVPTVITVFSDKSFKFQMKTPPAPFLLLKLRVSSRLPVSQTRTRLEL